LQTHIKRGGREGGQLYAVREASRRVVLYLAAGRCICLHYKLEGEKRKGVRRRGVGRRGVQKAKKRKGLGGGDNVENLGGGGRDGKKRGGKEKRSFAQEN